MGGNERELRLPRVDKELRRWRLRVREDGFSLSDWNAGQRMVGPVAAGFFWVWVLIFAASLVWAVIEAMTAYGRGTWGYGSLGWLGVVFVVLLGIIPGLLLMTSMQSLGMDRRSAVVVDRFGRSCVLKRWRWGWRTARREVTLGEADWEIMPGVWRRKVKEQVSLGQGLVAIALLFAGPLGWLIAIIRAVTNKDDGRGRSGAERVEVVRLALVNGNGQRLAVVTFAEEETAMAFLGAWDGARG